MYKEKISLYFLICVIGFTLGVILQKYGYISHTITAAQKQLKRFNHTLKEKEYISIRIKPEDFKKLSLERDKALMEGILNSEDFVPAEIIYKNNVILAEIRLKGDWTDHLKGEKWSFRVKIKDDKTLFGIKVFSLHHPKARNYIYEWIYHETLKLEGVLSLRYKFINLSINDKELGIYAMEEHFDKLMLEYNQRREGPIIKFNEDALWEERKKYPRIKSNPSGLEEESSAFIDVFKKKSTLKDSSLSRQWTIARNLLEQFRNHQLPASKVFDTEKLAKYFAVSDLLGAYHGAGFWHNLRFYYNPVISKLEPIAFDGNDGNAGIEISNIFGAGMTQNTAPDFYQSIFNDSLFFKQYMLALKRLSHKTYLDNLFTRINGTLKDNLEFLKSEFPDFNFSQEIFYSNQKLIDVIVNPARGLLAYLNNCEKDYIEIELGNIQSMPVEILSVSCNDSVLFIPKEKIFLKGKNPLNRVSYFQKLFYHSAKLDWSKILVRKWKINYKIIGTEEVKKEKVFPFSRTDENILNNDIMRQEANIHKFNFLIIDENKKEIYIKPGEWSINNNLIIPKGYTLIAKENISLVLTNSAKILSYSPLRFIGNEQRPIVIRSQNGQGIAILQAKENTLLKYVRFENLSNPFQGGWQLSGSVTFYESPVVIENCKFISTKSEDAINFIKSEFTIKHSIFNNIQSDAIDADFSRGTISNTDILHCKNDAVDLSESSIDINNVNIYYAGDKGISAGENSRVNIENIRIINTNTAIASKDLSEIRINNITIDGCNNGYVLFQKKPEYGSASIVSMNSSLKKTAKPYRIEKGSVLLVNGKQIKANE